MKSLIRDNAPLNKSKEWQLCSNSLNWRNRIMKQVTLVTLSRKSNENQVDHVKERDPAERDKDQLM